MTKAEGRTIELSVENLTYVHTNEEEEEENEEEQKAEVAFEEMDEVARNLFTFRLDHDYTPFTSPTQSPTREADEPVDELAETLSLLDGGDLETVTGSPKKLMVKSVLKAPVIKKVQQEPQQQLVNQKVVKTQQKTRQVKTKAKEVELEETDEEGDEDFEEDAEDTNDNDSDFELEEPKQRLPKRSPRIRAVKTALEVKKQAKAIKTATVKSKAAIKPAVEEKPLEKPPQSLETTSTAIEKQTEKKQAKKEKKTPKPIPDDFALFSTPDIIRRVGGGKEQTSPQTPESSPATPKQPAKISPENRSKSNTEQRNSFSQKPLAARLSVDSKAATSPKTATEKVKVAARRVSTDKGKVTTKAASERKASIETQKSLTEDTNVNNENTFSTEASMELGPAAEDTLNATSTNSLPDISLEQQTMDHLETAGLDLDQSILDNINSDMISDDILYQVAKQLVDNTDLQNAIDKSLAEGNLVLDPSLMAEGQDVIPENVQQNTQVSAMCALHLYFYVFSLLF